MSGTFLLLTLVAAILLVNWRVVLVVLLAVLIALVVLGTGALRPNNAEAVGQPGFTSPAVVTQPPTVV
ncbi:hypothetical protein SAMN05443637_110163 [Pseudonocardia thermophila]|jgi:hypothetical protein|uniref:Uncharacterized protein n=1 Tax=Pseudonocardia thermophila TaxID=1848 RepID=A0A1M6ULX5_PSETH|nr:hypothetical protein [Pseudonocardia thermophila]SHK70130.1 hypothetical protein SAMN05443637_110163 [Pseudonocardia thermophila]